MLSCTDAEFVVDDGQNSGVPYEGDVLTVNFTLDNMGGATTRVIPALDDLDKWENYIDPEKVRVLFFSCEEDGENGEKKDLFLFESKSRWVRQLDSNPERSLWSVSVPMYSNSNDME